MNEIPPDGATEKGREYLSEIAITERLDGPLDDAVDQQYLFLNDDAPLYGAVDALWNYGKFNSESEDANKAIALLQRWEKSKVRTVARWLIRRRLKRRVSRLINRLQNRNG